VIGGISVWQLLILLLIVILVFGTKRLRNIGGDLGSAIKGFRKGMEEEPEEPPAEKLSADPEVPESAANLENGEKTTNKSGTDA